MKIAILHPSYDDSQSPCKDFDLDCDSSRHAPEHDYTLFRIAKPTAVAPSGRSLRSFHYATQMCSNGLSWCFILSFHFGTKHLSDARICKLAPTTRMWHFVQVT